VKRRLRKLICRATGGHHYVLRSVTVAGVAIIVPRCSCGHVDIERIQESPWNRRARRRRQRQLGMR